MKIGSFDQRQQDSSVSVTIETTPSELLMLSSWQKQRLFRLWGRDLELAGYVPADVVLADTTIPPARGDIVIVEIIDLTTGGTKLRARKYAPPYVVTVTMDPKIMESAKAAATAQVDPTKPETARIANTVAVVGKGEPRKVLALVANRPYGLDTSQGQTVQRLPTTFAPLGSGSTFKIFTAAAAMEAGYGTNYVLQTPPQVSINVGGNRLTMADLRAGFEAEDFVNVETVVASGNVLFDFDKRPTKGLEEKLGRMLADRFGMGAKLMRTPGDGLHGQPCEPRSDLVDRGVERDGMLRVGFAMPGDAHAFEPGAVGSARCRTVVAHRLALCEEQRNSTLRRLWHALDQGPINLARLPRAEDLPEVGSHLPVAGDKQNARRVPIEPMHQHRPVATRIRESLQEAIEVFARAGAPLDGKPERLIQHNDVAVLVEDEILDASAIALGRGAWPRPGLRGIRLEMERRHADALPLRQAGRNLDATAVDPHLTRADDLVQVSQREGRLPPLEPAVEAHAVFFTFDRQDDGTHAR